MFTEDRQWQSAESIMGTLLVPGNQSLVRDLPHRHATVRFLQAADNLRFIESRSFNENVVTLSCQKALPSDGLHARGSLRYELATF